MRRKRQHKGGQSAAPRIKDVALALGMSVATVSRALSRPDDVNPETFKRVMSVVEDLGYRPNLIARSLRRGQSRSILVLVPNLSPFFLEVYAGVEEAAREMDFSTLLGNDGGDSERELAYFDQASSGRADGIVLLTGFAPAAYALGKRKLPPLVAALERLDGRDTPVVVTDHRAGARAATAHLIELGHRRIAHLGGHRNAQSAMHRLEGYRDALREADITVNPEFIRPGDFSVASGAAGMEHLLQLSSPPTAVFAANDEMAFGAMDLLRRRGLSVPQDVSVVGFDDLSLAAIYNPPLTTVSIPRHEIGRRCVPELIKLLNGDHVAGEILLRTRLVIRDSTAAPRSKRVRRSG